MLGKFLLMSAKKDRQAELIKSLGYIALEASGTFYKKNGLVISICGDGIFYKQKGGPRRPLP